MSSIYKIILLLVLPISVLAQESPYLAEPNENEADSLRRVFETTSSDTVKMEVSRLLGFYYHEKNTDSAFFFQTQQLELARNLRFRLWEADALELSGFISKNMGRYPVSLQYFQKALRITEDSKNEQNCWKPEVLSMAGTPRAARLTIRAFIHLDMAGLFENTGDQEKDLLHYKECLKISKNLNDNALLSLGCGSIVDVFMNKDMLDSALFYSQLEIKYTKKSGYYKYYGGALKNIGIIYFKLGDFENSRTYYDRAINAARKIGNFRNLGEVYLELSKLFLQIGQPDSSLYFTRKGLQISKMSSLQRLELATFKMLTKIFANTGMIDSAYFYQNAAIASADSMFSEEKIVHMQNLEFSEQLRLNELKEEQEKYQNKIRTRALLSGLVLILAVAGILYRNSRIRRKAYKLLHKQKNEIQSTLAELKTTQAQLIHSEKMASLGELTAGIAHEIQNPLNFVNNFSDVSVDLIKEMNEEMAIGNSEEAIAIAEDLQQNLEKITIHGKRASFIVNGMLEHSRTNTSDKKPTDINVLADEFLRLSYHGLRAKDKSLPGRQAGFNAEFKTDFDKDLPKINVIPQDFGRVLLNLINNAFYACAERSRSACAERSRSACAERSRSTANNNSGQDLERYKPTVIVSTKLIGNKVEIKVSDNGNGIPSHIMDKIFQPFFTTKPTGEGTGLGLSLSYDIINKGHQGELKVKTKEGEGTEFIILIPEK